MTNGDFMLLACFTMLLASLSIITYTLFVHTAIKDRRADLQNDLELRLH